MQAREFDNLMDGKPAKLAEIFKEACGGNELLDALNRAKRIGATEEEIKNARAEIEKREVEISPAERTRMDSFIAKQREIGTKERTIRRMVQRMWNITVV